MTLRELDGKLIVLEKASANGRIVGQTETLSEADGVRFLCPKCWVTNGNSEIGTHEVWCWFNKITVPPDLTPLPGRWNPQGTGIDDLTFIPPGMTSVQVVGGCNWHGFVENGRVRDA